MAAVSFTVPGRIGGKGRARSFLRGGTIAHITPDKTRSDEAVVRQLGALAMRGKPLLVGALKFSMTVYRVRPKSWGKKQRERTFYAMGKPDADNQAKLFADALNGIAYRDDSQIAMLKVLRLYAQGESVVVTIEELDGCLFGGQLEAGDGR